MTIQTLPTPVRGRPVYLEHFSLTHPPFRLTPAIDCFFKGAERAALLQAMTYALVHGDGITMLTGEVGTGKTTLSRVLMSQASSQLQFIYIANPALSASELQLAVAHEMRLQGARRGPELIGRIQRELIRLHASGRQVVMLIDEAHEMPVATLQQIRLLTNLETSAQKLLQVLLVGQPELKSLLAKTALRPLRDRIANSFEVCALGEVDTADYLDFRLRHAGATRTLFTPRAIDLISQESGGLARRVNIMAEKSLLAAFAEGLDVVTDDHVQMAVQELAEILPPALTSQPGLAGWVVAGINRLAVASRAIPAR
ncbi:MAG: ExeA family protein [Burkholderiaceae bacterium]